MKKLNHSFLYVSVGLASLFTCLVLAAYHVNGFMGSFSFAEPDFEPIDALEESWLPEPLRDPYADWQRPAGPWRVGIQAGHWRAQEAPEEQAGLRDNTGAQAGGVTEWETNLKIAEEVKKTLELEGVVVDLLPTTIPPEYWADAFVSIHADGSGDIDIQGYKVAAPRRDRSGLAERLSTLIEGSYGSTTGLSLSPTVSRNMRGYYAFNWRKYDHAIHPMTPGAIIETGFLTSGKDRKIIVNNPKRSAQGIAQGILSFLKETLPNASATGTKTEIKK